MSSKITKDYQTNLSIYKSSNIDISPEEINCLACSSISLIVLCILYIIVTIHLIIIGILYFFDPYLDEKTKDNLNNTNKDVTQFRNKFIRGR